MRWSWFFMGVALLLAGSYLDNTRGTLLPALSQQMSFDYKTFGEVLIAGHFTACVMTWLLIPVLNRISLRLATAGAAFLAVCLGISVLWVDQSKDLIFWGALLGGVVSLCGALSNLFVQRAAPHRIRSRAMAAAHASYGLASFIAPLVVAALLASGVSWRFLYIGMIPVFVALTAYCWRAIPSRAKQSLHMQDLPQAGHLTLQQWLMVLVILLYVAGEVLTSMWMTTWFVSRGKDIETGAYYTAVFFALMTITRILCSFLLKPEWQQRVLWASLVVPVSCFTAGRVFEIDWLIPCMGLLGPFFPVYVAQLGIRFPDRDRTIAIWVVSLMQATLGLMHISVGELAQKLGMNLAYWMAPLVLVVCGLVLAIVQKALHEHPVEDPSVH